jgi:bifunctional non-homologous end joining protein LigD
VAREASQGRRAVRLSSEDRVLWPGEGITKGDLFDYYRDVAPTLVSHLRNRPFTMKRFRGGIGAPSFFQKDAPKGMPQWIKTRTFRTHPREGGSRLVRFPVVNDELALLWMVQMHCIDMNAWYSQVDKPHRPDFVLFDLDPPDDDFSASVEVALLIRDALDELGLQGWPKTSGAGGMHVLVPIARRSGYDDTYEFAERLSKLLQERHPGELTTEWRKEKRRGVLVDHRQNGWGKTIASAYSVRPKPGAPVSTPLRWEELDGRLDYRAFTMDAARQRLELEGDLFAPVLETRQVLGPALRELRKAGRSEPERRPRRRSG